MTERMPSPRGVSAAPPCNAMVSGGLLSYRCALPFYHHEHGPADDREPCYAVESDRSRRAWTAWRERQDAREAGNTPPQVLRCPRCGEEALEVGPIGAKCSHCGETAEFQTEVSQRAKMTRAEAEVFYEEDEVPPPQMSVPQEVLDALPDEAPALQQMAARRQTPDTAELPEDVTGHTLTGYYKHSDSGRKCSFHNRLGKWVTFVQGGPPRECLLDHPSRTREGDQVIPSGDESIEDDQTGLIRDIEQRRDLGIQRYGQGHRPFNGRDTLQDFYDEHLDALVYLHSLKRMADATRDDLVEAVTGALNREGVYDEAVVNPEIAKVVVDRIMGWVVGAHLLPPQQPGDVQELILDCLSSGREIGASDRQMAAALSRVLVSKVWALPDDLATSFGGCLREDLTDEEQEQARQIGADALMLMRDRAHEAGLLNGETEQRLFRGN